jgi:hypothetical protein
MALWYLSFANNGWLGSSIVEAKDEISATDIGLESSIPAEFRNRLLNKEDLVMLDMAGGGNGELGIVKT